MIKSSLVIFIIISFLGKSIGQNHGQSIFQILDLYPSARTLALGNSMISARDSDVVFFQSNPALAQRYEKNQIAFNHSFYYSGASYSTLAGSYHLDKQNITFIGGLQSLRYGDIIATDEFGNKTGTYTASENKISIGASKKLFDPLSIGINLNFIFSNIETYASSGIGIDLGASYKINDLQSAALVIKNIGTQWDLYADEKESLPFDVQLGYSHRLRYVPFQINVLANKLHRWNLRGPDQESEVTILGEPIAGPSAFSKQVDNFFRHITIGGEVFLGKYAPLRLRLAYNHRRHQELKDNSYRGLSGFSFGFGVKMSRIHIDYGLANYHLAGSVHALGLAFNW